MPAARAARMAGWSRPPPPRPCWRSRSPWSFPYNYSSTGPLTTIKLRGRTFRYRPTTRHVAVRTLDVSASGGNLIADSRILWSEVPPETDGYSSGGCSGFQDALVSADGETVMCTSSYGPDTGRPAGKIVPWHLAWLATSVAAPKTARPVYAFTIDAPIGAQGWLFALWSNASGSTMIGSWYFGSSTTPPVHFGVMSHGTFNIVETKDTFKTHTATTHDLVSLSSIRLAQLSCAALKCEMQKCTQHNTI